MKQFTYDNLMLNGRLGNQLWQIAATLCRAELEEDGGAAIFRPDWEYRKFFSVPDYYFGEKDPDLETVDGQTEYFQEYQYFEPIEDMVRTFFKPSPEARMALTSSWAYDYATDRDTVCSVHIRRGDYLKYPKHFPQLTSEYFKNAIADVKSRNDDVAFVVFSDDPQWCKDNPDFFGFKNEEVIWHTGVVRPVEVADRKGDPADQWDMFAMTMMDEHIISNSTFAWWGAFLSDNKQPIYPDRWFGPAVPNWKRWEMAMPSSWRKFSC